MTFWIPAALLALAAMGFALAPFLRRDTGGSAGTPDPSNAESSGVSDSPGSRDSRGTGAGRDRALRALYRQRLQELEEEAATGTVEASSRAEIERELDRGLLDEFGGESVAPRAEGSGHPRGVVGMKTAGRGEAAEQAAGAGGASAPAGADSGSGAPRRGRWPLLAAGIPLLALALYLLVGEPDANLLREARVVLELDPARDRLELDRWRVRLAERVERAPEDAQSRYLLGRVYLNDGEYERAAQSFARAHAIAGNDPGIDLVWLQALFLANGGLLDQAGNVIAGRILEREPDQPAVLEMMAFDAWRRGDFRESVRRFDRALGQAVEPTRRAALELFLGEARSKLGDLQPRIDVELKALEAPPASATLFVIARPVGGGMPFAVVRRAASPLPGAVRLDDAVSMNPALPLSAAGEVELVVRVSLTGAAAPHPGDWEWRSGPLSLAGEGTLALVAKLASPGTHRLEE